MDAEELAQLVHIHRAATIGVYSKIPNYNAWCAALTQICLDHGLCMDTMFQSYDGLPTDRPGQPYSTATTVKRMCDAGVDPEVIASVFLLTLKA
jgi:hypothetical protein